MPILIRPARKEEQEAIVALIQQAKISPRNLHWEHFLVAEEDGKIIGTRQVRIHKEGTREVGSGYVLPAYRHQGISAQLMNEILNREKGTLYLMCRDKWMPYYERFGFRQIAVDQLPADFRKEYRIGKLITSVISLFMKDKVRILPMKRSAS
jgi:N-acetylglutamate synthase-like GNAT family acetyltransferase